ncbi:hypothetical protein JOF36_005938 [Pseudonocardia parietis]|uniref:Uncharacterized protein n=1 Tax=Pseudonocardia parietis TaxID=570936 RepID=A0ABS4W209_9PSEU|nr:hypothetical protein [Pseudonocardia parietis]
MTDDLCPGCTALARRPVSRTECEAALRRVGHVEEATDG